MVDTRRVMSAGVMVRAAVSDRTGVDGQLTVR